MHHGEYLARVTFDEQLGSFFGEIVNTADVITFYGRSVDELRQEMTTSIEVHLEACAAMGVEPSRTYSGRFDLSLDPEAHARIAAAAAADNKSMNAWIAETLARAADRTLTE